MKKILILGLACAVAFSGSIEAKGKRGEWKEKRGQ